jgi:hypothetical protein
VEKFQHPDRRFSFVVSSHGPYVSHFAAGEIFPTASSLLDVMDLILARRSVRQRGRSGGQP